MLDYILAVNLQDLGMYIAPSVTGLDALIDVQFAWMPIPHQKPCKTISVQLEVHLEILKSAS